MPHDPTPNLSDLTEPELEAAAGYLEMGIKVWRAFLAKLQQAQEKAQEEAAGA